MTPKKPAKLTLSELIAMVLGMPPASRAGDPDTSREAKQVYLTEDRIDVIRRYRDAKKGRYGPECQLGMTDYDLAHVMGRQQNSVGKRRGEWRDWWCIEAVVINEEVQKRPAPSTSPCIVWEITELGVNVCDKLDEMEIFGS